MHKGRFARGRKKLADRASPNNEPDRARGTRRGKALQAGCGRHAAVATDGFGLFALRRRRSKRKGRVGRGMDCGPTVGAMHPLAATWTDNKILLKLHINRESEDIMRRL